MVSHVQQSSFVTVPPMPVIKQILPPSFTGYLSFKHILKHNIWWKFEYANRKTEIINSTKKTYQT